MKKIIKKIIVVMTIAVAYCIFIVEINRNYILSLNQLEQRIWQDNAGNLYMVKNSKNRSDIIRISKNNQISVVDSILNQKENQRIEIVDIDVENDAVYILIKDSGTKNNIRKWQVLKSSGNDRERQILFEINENIDIKELSVQNEKLYLSALGESGNIYIYEADLLAEDVIPELIMERSLTEKVSSLIFYSGKIFVLSCAGNVWTFADNTPIQLNGKSEGEYTLMERCRDFLFLYNQKEHTLYARIMEAAEIENNTVESRTNDANSRIIAGFPKGTAVRSVSGNNESQIHILVSDEEGNPALYNSEYGSLTNRTREINESGQNIRAPYFRLLAATLIYLIIAGMVILLVWVYGKSKRLTVRISMISIGMASILIAALTYAAYRYNVEVAKKEQNSFCSLNNRTQMKLIENISFQQISVGKDSSHTPPYTFYQTEDYQKLKELLSDEFLAEGENTVESRQFLLYSHEKEKEIYIIGSGNDAAIIGSYINAEISSECISIIRQGVAEKESISSIITEGNEKYAVTVAPVKQQVQNGIFLMTLVSMGDMANLKKDALINLSAMALCIMIITTILLIISIQIALHPIQRLSVAMSQAAEGKIYEQEYKFMQFKMPGHEIGTIWISLKKMCKALQKKNYIHANVLQSYYRFVPRKLEKLLKKETIMEVKVGDVRYINGTLGVISVAEQEEVYKNINHTEYMKYVNQCFRTISRNSEENQGILLSNDFNLSSVKIMFPDSPGKAVTSGIEIVNALTGAGNLTTNLPGISLESQSQCRPVVVVHSAPFLYGIAGTEEQAFPFISSGEIEVLSRFVPEFRKTGIRMVITEHTVKKMKRYYNMRYIGYVVSKAEKDAVVTGSFQQYQKDACDKQECKNEKNTFRLYEILDVYSEMEKNVRLKEDAEFQEGIQMFYRNDFYLARSHFAEVLKECPGDGIAKWYLFTCEAMLNEENYEEIRYDLFADNKKGKRQ